MALAILVGGGPAFGWGFVGHRASARLVETLLTPKTKEAIRGLLEPGETLGNASTWPDEHRRELPETAPWHYVNVPITESKYDAKFCASQKGGCVVGKIPDFLATLKDPAASVERKRFALRFLVHCVQDMHQPVHVGHRGDRGGNDLQVQFFGQGSNLHRVWDSGLLDQGRSTRANPSMFALLSQGASRPSSSATTWSKGTVDRPGPTRVSKPPAAPTSPRPKIRPRSRKGAKLGQRLTRTRISAGRRASALAQAVGSARLGLERPCFPDEPPGPRSISRSTGLGQAMRLTGR